MGKDGGFLTPKAIANRIKAKGLQKLRWYCQMCEKQYRDENGFKQHCTSESHLRQMQLFADSPDKILGSYSKEFLQEFMKLLSKRYGTRRVHANLVYQEYISDRNHLHMNATHWASLSEFVKHLGRERLCNVEETEKGWFITWIDRSPETLAKQEAIQKKERMERSDEERARKALQEQMEKAQKQMQESGQAPTELKRDKAEEPIKLQMKTMFTAKPFKKLETKRLNALASTSKKSSPSLSSTPASPTPTSISTSTSKTSKPPSEPPKKLSTLDLIKMDDAARKRKAEGHGRQEDKRRR